MHANCVVFIMNSSKPQKHTTLYKARWWHPLENKEVGCRLCPHRCHLKDGQSGTCHVRINQQGQLFSQVWGKPVAVHVDPIEKKPLYHFLPGSWVYSIGTVGCNLRCAFCQNWDISTAGGNEDDPTIIEPSEIVRSALDNGCRSVAFTYNEPTIFGEYVVDIARPARLAGLKTVMVTNGYITSEAIKEIYPLIDAANIDLKSMNPDFYKKYCRADLNSVLEAIVAIRECGTLIELTTLLIPGLNDDDSEMKKLADWIIKELGRDTPVHFSAFHPAYKMTDRSPTSKRILDRARRIASEAGLQYIYEGNVYTEDEADTFCPACRKLLISRKWNVTISQNLYGNQCECGQVIPIVL